MTTSQVEEKLVMDGTANELHMPLSSTTILKLKRKLSKPLDFESNSTIDALFDSRPEFVATTQNEFDRNQQQPSANIVKIDDPHSFQIQVTNGKIEKPLAAARLKFDVRNHNFAGGFVVMKKLTGPIISLHFMRHNRVVIDTTHGLNIFPHLLMQVKSSASKIGAKLQTVLLDDAKTKPLLTTKTIAASVDQPPERNRTAAVTLLENMLMVDFPVSKENLHY